MTGHKEFELKYGNRVEKFTVDRDTHTMVFDMRIVEAEIVKKFLELLEEKPRISPAAIAIGWFNVPFREIYSEAFARTEFELDDATLAQIVRLRQERKEQDEGNGKA